MSHFVKLCKFCGRMMSTCRCPSKDKAITVGVCPTCTKRLQDGETLNELTTDELTNLRKLQS